MSDTWLDFARDKVAEEKEAQHWARYDYCYRDCDEHSLEHPCPYCDVEQESWDFDNCFDDKGGID